MNVNKLKGKVVEKGMTIAQFAKALGINKSTIYRKFSADGLSIGEAQKAAELLCLTADEAMAIFFPAYVA